MPTAEHDPLAPPPLQRLVGGRGLAGTHSLRHKETSHSVRPDAAPERADVASAREDVARQPSDGLLGRTPHHLAPEDRKSEDDQLNTYRGRAPPPLAPLPHLLERPPVPLRGGGGVVPRRRRLAGSHAVPVLVGAAERVLRPRQALRRRSLPKGVRRAVVRAAAYALPVGAQCRRPQLRVRVALRGGALEGASRRRRVPPRPKLAPVAKAAQHELRGRAAGGGGALHPRAGGRGARVLRLGEPDDERVALTCGQAQARLRLAPGG